MPELPEVEHLRRTLAPRLVGRRVERVALRRPDVARAAHRDALRPARAADLLRGGRVRSLERRGKQLAILAHDGRVLVVHLGMTGSLTLGGGPPDRHTHVLWTMDDGARLHFRDPRRFGRLRAFATRADLQRLCWSDLGPDAATIEPEPLAAAMGQSRRALKAALLDQRRLAGVGNIYADEALFRAGLHPRRACCSLGAEEWARLAGAVRRVLEEAVRAGGSTLRDYVDGTGRPGGFAASHRVYGRAGQACSGCGSVLRSERIAQRTTCFCPACQPRAPRSGQGG